MIYLTLHLTLFVRDQDKFEIFLLLIDNRKAYSRIDVSATDVCCNVYNDRQSPSIPNCIVQ